MLRFVTGGFSLFFLLVLLYLVFRSFLHSCRERTSPGKITGETLSDDLREAALRPLRQLGMYYEKRDPALADACIDETMLSDELLILGTNPSEIFQGRDGARHLLQCDWKYWGQLSLGVKQTAFGRVGNILYFVTRGQVKLNIYHFRIPIKVTGVLEERDGLWRIGKMQFVNELEDSYMIISWVVSLALMVCLLLFGLSWILHI